MEGETSYAKQHSLVGYTEREIEDRRESKRIKIAKNSEQVYQFVEDSITLQIKGEKLLLGKISENLARRIEKETNMNLQEYNLELRSDDIKHLINKHGNDKLEKQRGQRAVTAKDILCFADIVTNYEYIILDPKEENYLIFIKNINSRVSAVAMYAHKNKSLSLKTMYISRKKARG
jgi:AraC-like DNA-binding protein